MLQSAGSGDGGFKQQLHRYSQQPPQPPRPMSYREQKAERSNRSEGQKLETRLRVMEKEREHKRHTESVEKRLVLRQVEEIHRTTGYSPLGVRPDRGDQVLRESAYFTSGRKLSEKALGRWKLHEASAERELRLTGAEVRQRQDQQDALNQLLLELGVIERRRPTVASSDAAPSRRHHGRSHSTPPVIGSDSGSGSGGGGRGWQARAAARAEAAAASAEAAAKAPSNSRLVRADAVAALSRLADKQSRMFNGRGELLRKATIGAGGRSASASTAEKASPLPPAPATSEDSDSDADVGDNSGKVAEGVENGAGEEGDTLAPQWKRQLRREAPPGLHDPRRRVARVQLTVSRASLKQQLRDLVARQNRQGDLRLPAMRVVRRPVTE